MPTRNSSRTLEACLTSIRKQTHPDVELIVVDNHSTDGSLELARRIADSVLVAGPERSTQRNLGAKASSGEFLLFVDSDQVLNRLVAEQSVDKFRREARVQALVIPERSIGDGYWADCRTLEKELYLGDSDVEAARAFRRDSFDSAKGYDERIQAGPEDWDLPERLMAAGAVIGRIEAEILHDEGRLSLSHALRKKFHYGAGFARYARAKPDRAITKILRVAFLRQRKLLLRDYRHAVGLVALKGLELCALASGALLSRRAGRAAEAGGFGDHESNRVRKSARGERAKDASLDRE